MNKLFMKIFRGVLVLIFVVLTAASCRSDKGGLRYMAVQLVGSDLWSIIDLRSGEVIHRDEFKEKPSLIVGDLFYVENSDGLYDYYSVHDVNKPINRESYVDATLFNQNGVALVVRHDNRIAVINTRCETVAELDPSIRRAVAFVSGYAIVVSDEKKYGFIDEKGRMVIPPTFDSATAFFEGIAFVGEELDDSTYRYTAIDTNGRELFSLSSEEYSYIGLFYDELALVVTNDGTWHLLNRKGKIVRSVAHIMGLDSNDFDGVNDLILHEDDKVYRLIDRDGQVILRAKYDVLMPAMYDCFPFIVSGKSYSKYFEAKKQGKRGVINRNGETLVPFDFEMLKFLDLGDKCVLFAGDDDQFALKDIKLNDLSKERFQDYSFRFRDNGEVTVE